MGQPLLPDHLVALEDSILADLRMRFRIQGLPCYGVAELTLNAALLGEGVLSIEALSLITNEGLLLRVPGNARVEPFNLSKAGTTLVPVYLHLLKISEREEEDGQPLIERCGEVAYRYQNVRLSTEQALSGAVFTIKLLEAVKSPEGLWTLSKETIPPVLQLGASPFFLKVLGTLTDAMELFRSNLTMDSSSYLSGDSLYSVKQCLRSVLKTQRILANLSQGIQLHPYYLYEEVQSLYADVCFYRNVSPEGVTLPYDHDHPVKLKEAMERLISQMQLVRNKPSYVPFKCLDNCYRADMPEDIRKAVGVYVLVQKRRLTDQIPMEHIKVAGALRLPFVHKMAIQGITLKRVERPSFHHTFGNEVEFYQICESGEWDYALNEKAVAFLRTPALDGADYYLYWRMRA